MRNCGLRRNDQDPAGRTKVIMSVAAPIQGSRLEPGKYCNRLDHSCMAKDGDRQRNMRCCAAPTVIRLRFILVISGAVKS